MAFEHRLCWKAFIKETLSGHYSNSYEKCLLFVFLQISYIQRGIISIQIFIYCFPKFPLIDFPVFSFDIRIQYLRLVKVFISRWISMNLFAHFYCFLHWYDEYVIKYMYIINNIPPFQRFTYFL